MCLEICFKRLCLATFENQVVENQDFCATTQHKILNQCNENQKFQIVKMKTK